MPKPSISRRWFLSAAIALLAIALVAAPLDFTPSDWDLSKSAAQAKGGGDKGGDRDGGKSASTKGSGKGGKGKGGKDGSKAKDWAKNKAQKRYAKALGLGVDGAAAKPGKAVHTFSAKQVKGLLGKSWKAATFVGPGFTNHGQRVSTMVKIAKALGFGAWVGAMQANFGTMQELGIASLQAAVTDAQSDVDAARAALAAGDPAIAAAEQALADAQAALDQTIADAKPGLGPKGEWATVDLDVNGDGIVDTTDLEAALALP